LREVRIGVIGLGRIGELHAKNLAFRVPRAKLVAVVDVDKGKLNKVVSELGVGGFEDYRDLLKGDIVDAVVIATPSYMHVKMVEEFAEASKHIFCEKPLALNLEGAKRCVKAVEKAGVKLQVGYMRRFDPGYSKAKKIVERGEIGRPVLIKLISRDPAPPPGWVADPKLSGGIFIDLASHDFDLARWLMRGEVRRVYVEGGALVYEEVRKYGDLDNAVINLLFEDGRIGNVDVSRNAVYGYDIRTEILGTEGAVVVGKWRETPLVLFKKGGFSCDTVWWFRERFAQAYLNEMITFVDCLLRDKDCPVTGYDGLKAVEIAMACKKSLEEGRPVTLPLD